ncbi:hypothetical protein ACH4GF_42310, partial [Streptomyces rimosus]|uniref:hypothetical protein n=1 Tax=Streptomyces rimosus TaxID=1927 RepID=UPI0037A817AC
PLSAALCHQFAELLHPQALTLVRRSGLPGTVGGLAGSPPISCLPVRPEAVVEFEADQAAPAEGTLGKGMLWSGPWRLWARSATGVSSMPRPVTTRARGLS